MILSIQKQSLTLAKSQQEKLNEAVVVMNKSLQVQNEFRPQKGAISRY